VESPDPFDEFVCRDLDVTVAEGFCGGFERLFADRKPALEPVEYRAITLVEGECGICLGHTSVRVARRINAVFTPRYPSRRSHPLRGRRGWHRGRRSLRSKTPRRRSLRGGVVDTPRRIHHP